METKFDFYAEFLTKSGAKTQRKWSMKNTNRQEAWSRGLRLIEQKEKSGLRFTGSCILYPKD